MIFTRRNFLVGTAALAVLPKSALAASDMDFTAQVIHDNLEKSIWLSTNRNGSRALYVVAAPWCPFCRQLYFAQKELEHDIDYRFVFMGFRRFGAAVANAYFSDENDQVGVFYSDPNASSNAISPRSVAFIDEVNTVSGHTMARGIGAIISGSGGSGSGQSFAYPTVVYGQEDQQVNAALGAWTILDQIHSATSVEATRGVKADRYMEMVRTPPQLSGLGRNHFAKKEGTFLFAAPSPDAPKVDIMGEGSGYNFDFASVVANEEWIGHRTFSNYDGLAWGRKSEFFTQ
ncbi:hypothetical protein LL06_14455 [Hoeflea sp. BAL378]|uniref:hypothetical protein n=1 Tax=Hoeflea sp. BAL378 TaxID=1547437 RepID=UPI0005148AB7|nr:hypothetical protein [Hoeflea sp. BAL378]KGF68816.1 hypothetical protein LL06_14455 [Hoeflea sp. BAL378]